MLKKIIISFCLLLTQFLVLTPSQAQTQSPTHIGYTSWDKMAKEKLKCNGDTIICVGNFVPQTTISSMQYDCVTNNFCLYSKPTVVYSSDSLVLYKMYKAKLSEFMKNNSPIVITIPHEEEFLPYLGVGQNGTIGFLVEYFPMGIHGVDLNTIDIHILYCDFNELLGCANEDLDRTSMEDGPCEICSKIGNPFDVRNGAKYEHAIDIDYPLTLSRNYSSRQRVPGMFGNNWRANYDKTINVIKNGGIITALAFVNPNGDQIIMQGTDGINFTALFPDQKQYKVTVTNNQVKLRKPDSSFEIYDLVNQRILSETYKGKTLTYQYHTNGLLASVTDVFQKHLDFSYNNAGFVNQITASNGDILTYSYVEGNMTTVRMNNIAQITYEYINSYLTGKRDGNDVKYASFTYDEKGRGIENKWITSDGHDIKKYTISYDNNQTNVTQDNGLSKSYKMTSSNHVKKISDMSWNGSTEKTYFDAAGNIYMKKGLNGQYEYYEYDSEGKITSYNNRSSKQINITWNNETNTPAQIVENTSSGKKTTVNYFDANNNDMGFRITGDNVEANYLTKARDSYGRITREETNYTNLGVIKTYAYYPISTNNNSGLLNSITVNTGAKIVINAYDSRANPTSITTNGVTKTMTYDYKGRVLTETVAGATNAYTYDTDGNMLTSLMATGYQMNMVYDTAGRLLSISDNMGGSSTFTMDDYTGQVLTTEINQNNSLVRARNKIIDSLGRTTEEWNATSRTKRLTSYYIQATNPDSTTDANGIATNYTWNDQGQNLSYETGADSNTNQYNVDGSINRITINTQSTTMEYDVFGRITTINSPDTGTRSSYTYDKSQDTYTDANRIMHTTSYGIGRLPSSVQHRNNNNDAIFENFKYDNYGQLTDINSNNSFIAYTRNNLGQLIKKSQNMLVMNGLKEFPVQYGYNSIGQKITDTYPSGLVVTYGYTNGFVTSILVNGVPVVNDVQYNTMLKEPKSWTLGGRSVTVNKDTDGLLTSFVETGIFNQEITTDNEGHILSLNDNVSNNIFNVSLNQNYGLLAGSINTKVLDYTFGMNQNVTWIKDGIVNYELEMQYGTNKVESLYYGNSETHFNYEYDSNGNTLKDHKGTYRYNFNNSLEYSDVKTVTNGYDDNIFTRYFYNGLNQRIAKWTQTQGGQAKYFVYNENNQVIGEYDSTGAVIAEYVYFGLRPVAVKRAGALNIVHTDYLGTPRIITTGTSGGSIVWQWKNDNPYGSNKAQGAFEFNLRFVGQYYDSETGLHYNMNRTYDPETGRYLQSDPIGLAGGNNTYNYVGRNPLDSVDPLGLSPGIALNFASATVANENHNLPITNFNNYLKTGILPNNMIVTLGHGLGNGEGNAAVVDLDSEAMQSLKNIDANFYSQIQQLNGCTLVSPLCNNQSRLIDGKVLAYIIKKLIAENSEYDTLFMSQCHGHVINNISSVANILKMNTWVSDGLVYIGLVNEQYQPMGTLNNNHINYLAIESQNLPMREKMEAIKKDPNFKVGIKGFIEYKKQ